MHESCQPTAPEAPRGGAVAGRLYIGNFTRIPKKIFKKLRHNPHMTTTSTPKKLHVDTQELVDNAAKKLDEKIKNNPFVAFTARYRNNPVLFVKEVLNTVPDEWQETMLNHIAKGERRISVRSGHGVGKSTGASWAIIWYLLLRYPVKVVVTAPTSSQLYDALFAELKRWVK